MKPIIPPKYNVAFRIHNNNSNLLETLEPWCSVMYSNMDYIPYITKEQPNTSFDLTDKLIHLHSELYNDFEGVTVIIDGNTINQQDFGIIQQLSEIISDSGEIGEFELGNLKILINNLNTFENQLILCKNE